MGRMVIDVICILVPITVFSMEQAHDSNAVLVLVTNSYADD